MNRSLIRRQFLPRLLKEARTLLVANTRTGIKDGRTYYFTVPSTEHYPFQWFWDSCFHAMAWVALGEIERAKEEIRSLLAWQEPNGFIPHVIFWDQSKVRRSIFRQWHYWESRGFWTFLPWVPKPKTSAEMQPPILAQAVECIFNACGDLAFLKEVLPNVERHYRYLAKHRDPDRDGLISTISSFETGCDFSPVYWGRRFARFGPLFSVAKPRFIPIVNKLLGYRLSWIFRFTNHHAEDVLVNSLYAQGLFALSRLALACPPFKRGDYRNVVLANWARFKAHRVRCALVEKCYDPESRIFWTLVGKNERRAKVKTVAALMPIILPDLPRPIVEHLRDHIVDPRSFATPLPLATVARNEPSFRPRNRFSEKYEKYSVIWTGAATGCIAKLIGDGLRLHGFNGIANTLWEKWARAADAYGWQEFYHPLCGRPPGEPTDVSGFGWATLIVTWAPPE